MVQAALAARAATFDVILVFLSLGTLTFCALLLRSRFVPRALSILGLVAFGVMLAGLVAGAVEPGLARYAMVSWASGILFEAGIGLWLLVKGVDVRAWEARLTA